MSSLRKHSCSIGVDYDKKLILVGPENGSSEIVLTTPVLHAWHANQLTTEKGIREWTFLDIVGWTKDEPILRLEEGYQICFCENKKIFVYGIIVTKEKARQPFIFHKSSSKQILGSPFIHDRKSVFLSHSSTDKPMVRNIFKDLENIFDVFFDEVSIEIGDSITNKLNKGLQGMSALVLCLSKNSANSDWVTKEYSYALHNEIPVYPIRLEECTPPPIMADIKYVDYYRDPSSLDILIKQIDLQQPIVKGE